MRSIHLRTCSGPVSLLLIIVLLAQMIPSRAWADDGAASAGGAHEGVVGDHVLRQADDAMRERSIDRHGAATDEGVVSMQGSLGRGDSRSSDDAPGVPNMLSYLDPQKAQRPGGTEASKRTPAGSQLSLPQGAAKLRGMGESFSADLSTGAARYAIPFELPVARGGAQPSLGLSYSSAGGLGVAGMGWGVGAPSISRQIDRGVPKYRDPAPGGGWYPEQDRFVSGTDELVPICLVTGTEGSLACAGAEPGEVMPAWGLGWQYFRARVESGFLRYFWSPDHRTWRVQDKNGLSMEFGAPLDGSADESALEVDPSNSARIYAWHLARAYDAMGDANAVAASPQPVNVVRYKYAPIDGATYLTDIFDTPPAANAATASVSSYAHHTHLRYEARPDRTTTYRRGWANQVTQRLQGVDVTSFDFQAGGQRHLLRRYHLAYEPGSHVSLLRAVEMEGRCAIAIAEDGGTSLLPTTSCPRLPALRLGYEHVEPYRADGSAGVVDLPGYEGFDERIRAFTTSPPHSINEALTDLADIDADGLPDVVVTDPARYGGPGVFFNRGSGFAPVQSMAIESVGGVNANVLKFSNPNLAVLDVDGDGIVDWVHMPRVKTYSIFTPHKSALEPSWVWRGREVTTSSEQSSKIDFTGRNPELRLMDVNADGLVDVVYTGASEVQTFLSLGRYPGGDGQYGHATWTGPASAAISNEPLASCIPWSGLPIRFSDPDVRVADMNGDGFPDIVRVRHGDIRYWPGRGDGFWGTGDPAECIAGRFGQERHVAMADSPRVTLMDEQPFLVDDVNGDGLADLVRVRFDAIDVYLNVNGVGWTERHVIEDVPHNSTITNRVRLADINGSGTPDLLWGDGLAYKYIDLQGGRRPWLLTRIENGLGATTDVEYATSVEQMLAAATAGDPWTSKAPTVAHVVSRVTQRDNLERVGRPSGAYATEYTYRDAVYDGRQRAFRGFRTVRATTIGDANSPTSISDAQFLLGECAPEPDVPGVCEPSERWRDNPREALTGLPVVTEVLDASGTYLSTEHTTYRLRRLYTGLDGRQVRHAFGSRSDRYRYDTAAFVPAAVSLSLVDVELERAAGVVTSDVLRPVTLRSAPGSASLGASADVDRFGNSVAQHSYGCVSGCAGSDDIIKTSSVFARPSGDLSGWLWRVTESYVQGGANPLLLGTKRNHVLHSYDAHGLPTFDQVSLTGTLPLTRFHEVATRDVAPPPAHAVTDGTFVAATFEHDAFGTRTATRSPIGGCTSTVLDPAFGQLVVEESTWTGYSSSPTVSCGPYALTSTAEYDRGLGAVTQVRDAQFRVSTATYDGFGRVVAIHEPDLIVPGVASAMPSTRFDYDLPPDGVRPYSTVRVRTQDGVSTGADSYREAWTFVDGLGRTIVTLSQGKAAAGGLGSWIVGGRFAYDAKGAMSRAYTNSFYIGDPTTYPLGATEAAPSVSARYDAFGRTYETSRLSMGPAPGPLAVRNIYHAMSSEAWDAADVEQGGPHEGTPSIARVDGHGRRVSEVQRVRVQGALQNHETKVTYLPTGEPEVIRRTGAGASEVVRWMRYDSFGRLVLNVDPDTTKDFNPSPTTHPNAMKAWRYAYDVMGRLVGTSDPQGCGVNFHYLTDGRPLGEDYSPCKEHHPEYSAPDLSTNAAYQVNGDGLESFSRYDFPDSDAFAIPGFLSGPVAMGWQGYLVSVSDRGSKTMFRHDGRGRVSAVARKMAKPGVPSSALADRYTEHWFVKTAAYDAAGRTIEETTGADVPELLGGDGDSVVTTEYSKRGTVERVGGSYGALVDDVSRDADGLVLQLVYGDLAHTTTTFGYDTLRRLSSVLTHRGPPVVWSAPPATYTPAPPTGAAPTVFQTVLENSSVTYDAVDNPTAITDLRDPAYWPGSYKPTTRQFAYDDLERLTQVQQLGTDTWASPFEDENTSTTSDRPLPSPHVSFPNRITSQTFVYDALGNTTASDDDAHGFYDRSLGTITNGSANAGPYQLKQASQPTGARAGSVSAAYDDAGHLTSLAVVRSGPCLPAGALCSQRFAYEWNEVGELSRARRWDVATPGGATDPLPSGAPAAELRYAYSDDGRALKTSVDGAGNELHTVYVFGSLELRRAEFVVADGDYERTRQTVAPYLFADGQRLARLYYSELDLPTLSSGKLHVLFELPDHLGSSSFVVDKETSEIVEATRYQAYGAPESDYRPERWKGYREDYGFTGKETDIEVGLMYFGARYFAPSLNRWISPDPLALHVPGEADLNLYAYVSGRALRAVDPFGLQGTDAGPSAPCGGTCTAGGTTDNGGTQTSWFYSHSSPETAGGGAATTTAQTPLGQAFEGLAQAHGGNISGAAQSGLAVVEQVTQPPLVKAIIGAAAGMEQDVRSGPARVSELQAAYKKGGARGAAKEHVRQVWGWMQERTPAIAPAKRFLESMGRAGGAQDLQTKAAATGDAVQSFLEVASDLETLGTAAGGLKPGSKGGPGAGKDFPKSVKEMAESQAGGKCVFCGSKTTRSPGPNQRNTDHAHPKSRGGNNTLENAQNTCRTCNLKKGAQTTWEFVSKIGKSLYGGK